MAPKRNTKRTSSATLRFAAARAMRAALLAAPLPAVGWTLTGIPAPVAARIGHYQVIQPATWAGVIVADTFYSQTSFIPGFGYVSPSHKKAGDNNNDFAGRF